MAKATASGVSAVSGGGSRVVATRRRVRKSVLKGIDDLASLVCNAARGWARDDPRDKAFKRMGEEAHVDAGARGVWGIAIAPIRSADEPGRGRIADR